MMDLAFDKVPQSTSRLAAGYFLIALGHYCVKVSFYSFSTPLLRYSIQNPLKIVFASK